MSFPLSVKTVTIAASEAVSGAAFVGHGLLVGLIVPAGWDTADITLLASPEGVTYYNVHNKGGDTEETIQAGASRHIWLDPPIRGLGWVKVRSGTGASPVNQNEAIDVQLVVEKNSAF